MHDHHGSHRARTKRGVLSTLRTLGLFCLAACTGSVGDSPLTASPFTALVVPAAVPLSEAGGSADERGGGIFVGADGKVVRLRLDGSTGRLEGHPQNPMPPGKVLRVFNAGPFVALVSTETGLYVAESGWLIEPSWRAVLDAAGIVAVAPGLEGSTWIAHQRGLFRIEQGQLAELKLEGAPITGLSALAVAPAPDGSPAVWFAQGETLSFARQGAQRGSYDVFDSQIEKSELAGGVKALAGLSASPDSRGELLLITASKLFQFSGSSWASKATPAAPSALIASGRYAWLYAGSALYRYDGNERSWSQVEGVTGAISPGGLLSAEPGGTAWIRAGEQSLAVSTGVTPRLLGLFESERVYQTELLVRAQFPVDKLPVAVTFALDDGESVERTQAQALMGEGAAKTLDFAWGGFDVAGREQPYSLVGFTQGMHTLTVTAKFMDGDKPVMQARALHFEFRGGSTTALSFAADVLPIAQGRCVKCHDGGPGHLLKTYEQWVMEKDKILSALVEQRMPADGPLDPTQLQTIQRWAVGGAAP